MRLRGESRSAAVGRGRGTLCLFCDISPSQGLGRVLPLGPGVSWLFVGDRNYGRTDDGRGIMTDDPEPPEAAPVYVPANLRAHVFQADIKDGEVGLFEWDTTVIAIRIQPDCDTWVFPILLDGTDSSYAGVYVFVEDQDGWTIAGDFSCKNLDAARKEAFRLAEAMEPPIKEPPQTPLAQHEPAGEIPVTHDMLVAGAEAYLAVMPDAPDPEHYNRVSFRGLEAAYRVMRKMEAT